MDGAPSSYEANTKEHIPNSSQEICHTEKVASCIESEREGAAEIRKTRRCNVENTRLTSGDPLIPGLCDDTSLHCLARVSHSDYGTLSCLNSRFNSLLTSGVLYEARRRIGIVEKWVFLFCDPRGWDAFDTCMSRWMRLPKMPCDECFNHADKESLAVGSELLVFGREYMDFAIWKYSMVHRNWRRCDGMNSPRCLFGSSSHGTIGILAGGSDKRGNILASAELYDSATGKWEMLPNMHTPRRLSSGFFMDGRFFVIGGMSGPTASLTCGEELDLVSRRWKKIEGMYPMVNKAAEAPPLVAVVENQLYTVEHSSNRVMRYVKERNTWVMVGRLPVRADISNGWGLGFKACGEDLLVAGGQRGPDGEGIVLNMWRPVKGGALEWRVVGVTEGVGVFVYNCAIMGC